jgi:hypothetical protein
VYQLQVRDVVIAARDPRVDVIKNREVSSKLDAKLTCPEAAMLILTFPLDDHPEVDHAVHDRVVLPLTELV